MIAAIARFQHDWEREYLEMTRDYVFRNTFRDIEWIVRTLSEQGTRFEFECYDIGHLYNLAHFVDAGVIEPPLFIQSVFGILGGIGPEVENLMHARATADRLFGTRLPVVGARGRAPPDAAGHDRRDHRRARPRRARGFDLPRARRARGEQRGAGREDHPHPARALARTRDTRRRPRDARAQGRRGDEARAPEPGPRRSRELRDQHLARV